MTPREFWVIVTLTAVIGLLAVGVIFEVLTGFSFVRAILG